MNSMYVGVGGRADMFDRMVGWGCSESEDVGRGKRFVVGWYR